MSSATSHSISTTSGGGGGGVELPHSWSVNASPTPLHSGNINGGSEPEEPLQLYPRRWAVLVLFSLLSFSNAMLWITFSPISSIVGDWYDQSDFMVNCLSMVYMAIYIPLVFASSWVFDRQGGLRIGTILGALLNAAGACMHA